MSKTPEKDYDLNVHVGGMPIVVTWNVTHHLMLTFEIDTDAVDAVLPEPLVPLELRPSISLLHVGVLKYAPGHFGPDSPVFDEIVAILSVPPNLSLPMPTPRFSFYALNVFSDSPDFVEGEKSTVYTPTVLREKFAATFTPDGLSATVADADGPIAEFANTGPEPTYKPGLLWGQHFNDTMGPIHNGTWTWEGELFEHQKEGDWGALHPHPFFKGLDISRVRRCYRQFFARVGPIHKERFYQVRRWPEGDE